MHFAKQVAFYIFNLLFESLIIHRLIPYPLFIMRNILLTAVIFLSVTLSIHAQDLRNANGSYWGTVEDDGDIRNSSGSYRGNFEDDGDIRNASGSYMGVIEDDGDIRNSSGSYMGVVETDGDVRDASGKYLGVIEDDGDVRDSSGRYLGSAAGVDKKQAACLFFFFDWENW